MIRIKNVLVATDFSEPSEAALNYGRELARSFDATLHVLHVADSIYMQYGGETYSGVVPELQDEVEKAARKQLDALAQALLARETLNEDEILDVTGLRPTASPGAPADVTVAANGGAASPS